MTKATLVRTQSTTRFGSGPYPIRSPQQTILSYRPAARLSTASSASQLAWMSLRIKKRTALGGNQAQQCNLGWRSDPHGNADRANASAHISRRRIAGWSGQAVVSVNKRCEEAGDIQRLAENLDSDLAAM